MKTFLIAVGLIFLLSACAAETPETPVTNQAQPSSAPAPIGYEQIDDVSDGVTWARGLSEKTPNLVDEMTAGIPLLVDSIVAADINAMANNSINQDLLSLQLDIFEDPENAASKVDDLNDIIDELEKWL